MPIDCPEGCDRNDCRTSGVPAFRLIVGVSAGLPSNCFHTSTPKNVGVTNRPAYLFGCAFATNFVRRRWVGFEPTIRSLQSFQLPQSILALTTPGYCDFLTFCATDGAKKIIELCCIIDNIQQHVRFGRYVPFSVYLRQIHANGAL